MVSVTDRLRGLGDLLREPPALLALGFNLAPVVCVPLFDWSPAILLLLYWAENVAIGVFNVFKMLIVGVREGVAGFFGGLFTAVFFTVHYGGFCLGHGLFALTFYGFEKGMPNDGQSLEILILKLPDLLLHEERGLLFSLVAIVALQAVGFVQWVAAGAWKSQDEGKLMSEPYGRIIVLHLGLFAMAFALGALGNPVLGVFGLALIKTLIDALWAGSKAKKARE